MKKRNKILVRGTLDRELAVGQTSDVSNQCRALTHAGERCTKSAAVALGLGGALCAQHAAMKSVTLAGSKKVIGDRKSKTATRRLRCPYCSVTFNMERRRRSHIHRKHGGKATNVALNRSVKGHLNGKPGGNIVVADRTRHGVEKTSRLTTRQSQRPSRAPAPALVEATLFTQMSPQDALRAIYIRFEGFRRETPTLVGIACEYDFEQTVLTDEFRSAATATTGVGSSTITDVVRQLIGRCRSENRKLVGYGLVERDLMTQHASMDPGQHYRDARAIGREWIAGMHPGKPGNRSLTELLRLAGRGVPRPFGERLTARRLKYVRTGLRTNRAFSAFSAVRKAKWTKLLRSNRIYCLGMRDIVIRATSEMNHGRQQRG